MSTPRIKWLTEVRVCRAIYRGIMEAGGAAAWKVAEADEQVFFAAAMFFAMSLGNPGTRGGQRAMEAAIAELRAHCVHEAIRHVRPGTLHPTAQQIEEYAAAGRAAAEETDRYIDACLARRAEASA